MCTGKRRLRVGRTTKDAIAKLQKQVATIDEYVCCDNPERFQLVIDEIIDHVKTIQNVHSIDEEMKDATNALDGVHTEGSLSENDSDKSDVSDSDDDDDDSEKRTLTPSDSARHTG
jgi:hypothetical protein